LISPYSPTIKSGLRPALTIALELDRADRQAATTGVPVPAAKVAELTGRIETLKARMQILAALAASGKNQISLTDPDARAMTSESHSAYNVQRDRDPRCAGVDRGDLGSRGLRMKSPGSTLE
jgi:hypothetical protein